MAPKSARFVERGAERADRAIIDLATLPPGARAMSDQTTLTTLDVAPDSPSRPGEQRSLRFGILCEGTVFPAWQARCIESLLSLPGLELSLLVVKTSPESAPLTLRQKLLVTREFSNFLYAVAFDRFVRSMCAALRPTDLTSVLSSVPTLRCEVIQKGRFSKYFAREDIEAIREQKLDFLMRFGIGIIRGDILHAARYGVWSFHHADEQKYRGGPPCFWEIYNDEPSIGAILQRLNERLDAGTILRKGFFPTIQGSYYRNLNQVFFRSATWPAEVCRDIQNGVAAYVDGSPSTTMAPVYRCPTPLQLALFTLKLAAYRWRADRNARNTLSWTLPDLSQQGNSSHEVNPYVE